MGPSRKARAFSSRVTALVVALLTAGAVGSGCSAVYPELSTPVRAPRANQELEPRPPGNLLYLAFGKATIPERTRDGRKWDAFGGSAPDPFAKLMVNGKEWIVTPIQSDTLKPTWPDQTRANYRIPTGSKIVVELWDSNPINNHPICSSRIRNLEERAETGTIEVTCDSGAVLTLIAERAHARVGLGMFYEFQTQDVVVTRVVRESPAGRAGLTRGTQLIRVQKRPVKGMDSDEVRSLINANARTKLELTVKRPGGALEDIALSEGPLYPEHDEGIELN
jgi:hypothetical protein